MLYVFGALSDWQYKTEFRLKYNYKRFGYEADILLKQGYYNYEYVFLKDGEEQGDETFIEGTHWETENDYTIYVYHHPIGANYDMLVGMKKINSMKN